MLFETKRGSPQRVYYSASETEETEAKADAKTQGTKAKKNSGRLTLEEETKTRELEQTALKFLQNRYFIDYSEMNENI